MIALSFAAALLLADNADAGSLAIGATGGWNYPTAQPWAGAEVALHATNKRGFYPTFRLAPGVALVDIGPLVPIEAGVQLGIPAKTAALRLGVRLRGEVITAKHRLPWQTGGRDNFGERHVGLIPGAMAELEFEWDKKLLFTFGVRAGAQSIASDYLCDDEGDPLECISWTPGFAGGFVGRLRLRNGFAVEVLGGPNPTLSIGWATPVFEKKKPEPPIEAVPTEAVPTQPP